MATKARAERDLLRAALREFHAFVQREMEQPGVRYRVDRADGLFRGGVVRGAGSGESGMSGSSFSEISYTPAGPGECVVEVGHRTRFDRIATWRDARRPVEEFRVCDHHKYQFQTAYDDYSDIVWAPISTDGGE